MAAITAAAFLSLALQCAPTVHPATLSPIVKTESDFNQWAIGVVGKTLPSQPQSLEEALAAVKMLVKEGANFSVGLGQINRQHFDVKNPAPMFDACTNLGMTANILQDCYVSSLPVSNSQQEALGKAISCYYSGNVSRGYKAEAEFGGTSHVQRVLANADTTIVPALVGGGANALQPPPTPVAPLPQPTYESWDVLRQYPRYEPAQQATPPEPKVQQLEKKDQEITDDQ